MFHCATNFIGPNQSLYTLTLTQQRVIKTCPREGWIMWFLSRIHLTWGFCKVPQLGDTKHFVVSQEKELS